MQESQTPRTDTPKGPRSHQLSQRLDALTMRLLDLERHLRPQSQPAVSPRAADGPLAVWQAEPCPAWCAGGHDDVERGADRMHHSPTLDVSMRLMPAVDLGTPWAHDYQPPELRACLRQNDGGGRTWLHLFSDDVGEHSIQLDFTLDEAGQLIVALNDLVKQGAQR